MRCSQIPGPRTLAISLAFLIGAAASPAWAEDVWSDPFPGVKRLHRTTGNQHINVLIVDLCAAGVSLRATAYSERGRTVPSFGSLVGAEAAINGDFFGAGFGTDGIAMHAGAAWGGSDHGYVAPVAIGEKKIDISHHANMFGVQPWMREVVSGHPTLLDDATFVGNSGDPLCTNRHPRTAIGITQDHTKLILAVVDGRAANRIGMTCGELANLLKELGAFDAVNMDGGGSSTMWLRGAGVVNFPSDGSPRVVGNHLAVLAKGSGAPAQCPCVAHCEGSEIHGNDCGVGDCAAFGSTCVDDSLGVRCVFAYCPAIGTDTVCVDETSIGNCTDGAVDIQSCPEGNICIDDGSDAACVDPSTLPPDAGAEPGNSDGGTESSNADGGTKPNTAEGGCNAGSAGGPLPAVVGAYVFGLFIAARRRRRNAGTRSS